MRPTLAGQILQTVRRFFRNRAPPPTPHQSLFPQGDSPPVEATSSKFTLLRDSDCVQPTRQQPPPRRDTPTLHETCHRTTPITSSAVMYATHSGQHPSLLAEQGACIVAGVVKMGDSSSPPT